MLLCAEERLSLPLASTANFKLCITLHLQEKNTSDGSVAILNFYRRLGWYIIFCFPFKLTSACCHMNTGLRCRLVSVFWSGFCIGVAVTMGESSLSSSSCPIKVLRRSGLSPL